jgi:hypothetical protein
MTNSKKTYIIIAAVILIGVGVGVAYWQYQKVSSPAVEKVQPLTIEQIKNDKTITSFGFQGTVTKIAGNKISLKTGSIQNTADGQQSGEQNKVVTVPEQTQIATISGVKSKLSDIKVGMSISVFTLAYPYDQNEVIASQITIN